MSQRIMDTSTAPKPALKKQTFGEPSIAEPGLGFPWFRAARAKGLTVAWPHWHNVPCCAKITRLTLPSLAIFRKSRPCTHFSDETASITHHATRTDREKHKRRQSRREEEKEKSRTCVLRATALATQNQRGAADWKKAEPKCVHLADMDCRTLSNPSGVES